MGFHRSHIFFYRLHVQAFLHKHGGAIHLLGLEGFIYEGTAAKLLRYLLEIADRHWDMRFVILDLNMVQVSAQHRDLSYVWDSKRSYPNTAGTGPIRMRTVWPSTPSAASESYSLRLCKSPILSGAFATSAHCVTRHRFDPGC